MGKRVQWHRPAGAIVGGQFNGHVVADDPWTVLEEDTVIAYGDVDKDEDGVERVSLSWNIPTPRFFPSRLPVDELKNWVGEFSEYGDSLTVIKG